MSNVEHRMSNAEWKKTSVGAFPALAFDIRHSTFGVHHFSSLGVLAPRIG